MTYEVLVLNSGDWELFEELPAAPWHILIYRQRQDCRNELHVWLPRGGDRGDRGYTFKRYWQNGDLRWCVEIPSDPDVGRTRPSEGPGIRRFRFAASDGRVLWAETRLPGRLGDITDAELEDMLKTAVVGPYTRI